MRVTKSIFKAWNWLVKNLGKGKHLSRICWNESPEGLFWHTGRGFPSARTKVVVAHGGATWHTPICNVDVGSYSSKLLTWVWWTTNSCKSSSDKNAMWIFGCRIIPSLKIRWLPFPLCTASFHNVRTPCSHGENGQKSRPHQYPSLTPSDVSSMDA